MAKKKRKNIKSFFQEIKIEMKKVNWPTKKETVKYTLIVLGATAVVAAYLGMLDAVFFRLLEKFVI